MSNDTQLKSIEQAEMAAGTRALRHGVVDLHRHGTQHAQSDEWELRMKRLNPNWAPHRVSLVEVV
jgi:hypothetical protein